MADLRRRLQRLRAAVQEKTDEDDVAAWRGLYARMEALSAGELATNIRCLCALETARGAAAAFEEGMPDDLAEERYMAAFEAALEAPTPYSTFRNALACRDYRPPYPFTEDPITLQELERAAEAEGSFLVERLFCAIVGQGYYPGLGSSSVFHAGASQEWIDGVKTYIGGKLGMLSLPIPWRSEET